MANDSSNAGNRSSSLDSVAKGHHMRTQSMDDIFKPKQKFSLATRYPLPSTLQAVRAPTEPTCYTYAIKLTVWRAAMALEFDALQRKRHMVHSPT